MANIDELVSGENGFNVMFGTDEFFCYCGSWFRTEFGDILFTKTDFKLDGKKILSYERPIKTLYVSIQPELIPQIKKEVKDLVTKEITKELYFLDHLRHGIPQKKRSLQLSLFESNEPSRTYFDGIYVAIKNGLKVRFDNVEDIKPLYDEGSFFFSYDNPISITSMISDAFCLTYESPNSR